MGPTLGQRLRALRIERGLSQSDLAGDLVSPSYVSLIESDRRSPEREVLEGLARRLGCSALYLESGVAPEEVNEQRLRLQFAKIAQANGELTEARAQFLSLTQAGTAEIRHEAAWGLAAAYEALGQLDDALTLLESLLSASKAGEPGTPGLLSLMNARCRIYCLAGDFARSIEVGEAALEQVRELGLDGSADAVRLASSLVGSYWARGDLFSAQHLASGVIERAEKLGSREAQGNAYWNAAGVAASRGQLTLALDLATKTLALLSESSPSDHLAGMRVTYAWLLLRFDPPRLDEAEQLLEQAHEVLADVGVSTALSSCETELARCALLRGNYSEAIELAELAVSSCPANAPERAYATVVSGLAMIKNGQPDDGARVITDAADQLSVLGTRLEAAQAWRDAAEALISAGLPDQAIKALRMAADYAGARSSVPSEQSAHIPVIR